MSIKETTKRVWDVEYKIEIDYCEFADSPREYSCDSKLCLREHRDYDFPNELDFDFDAFDEWEIELPTLEENQKLFWLSLYIHSWASFSLATYDENGRWTRWEFDYADGFIIAESEEQAKAEIEEYNSYLNWECYTLDMSMRDVIEKDWKTFYSDWEWVDTMSCIGWENLQAPSQYPFEVGEWGEFISN